MYYLKYSNKRESHRRWERKTKEKILFPINKTTLSKAVETQFIDSRFDKMQETD